MTRQAFTTADAPRPSAAYSQVVRVGNVIYTAGQAGLDPNTREFVSAEIEGQTVQALRNLQAALEAAGVNLSQVARVGVFLADLSLRAQMNAAYEGFFGEPAPARTTVGVDLPDGMLVEIDAVAVAD